jgi:hypothetical protein
MENKYNITDTSEKEKEKEKEKETQNNTNNNCVDMITPEPVEHIELSNSHKICSLCNEILNCVNFNCFVCERRMGCLRCNKCQITNEVLDVCSQKCRQIMNGEAHIIPLYYNHERFLVIEDFDEYMGIKVTDHKILKNVMTDTQLETFRKKCKHCEDGVYQLIPLKCKCCAENYSFDVDCSNCYVDNDGYMCEECYTEIHLS